MEPLNIVLPWAGAATGAAGALWLALKVPSSRWGFVCYLVSNMCWIAYGLSTAQWPLLAMNGVFTAISAFGVVRWFTAAQRRPVAPTMDVSLRSSEAREAWSGPTAAQWRD